VLVEAIETALVVVPSLLHQYLGKRRVVAASGLGYATVAPIASVGKV
jgi:hypothetical protein